MNSCELNAQLEAYQEFQEATAPPQDREPDYDLRSAEAGPQLGRSVSTPSMVSVGEEQVPGSGKCGCRGRRGGMGGEFGRRCKEDWNGLQNCSCEVERMRRSVLHL